MRLRPNLLRLSAAIFLSFSGSMALAQGSPGGGPGGGSDGGPGNGGQGGPPDAGPGPGGGPGPAGRPGDGADGGSDTPTLRRTPLPDQDEALKAVLADRALPLDQVLAATARVTSGEIVDVKLDEDVAGVLYVVKVLETNGEVRQFFFQARTGQLLRVE